MDLFLVLVEAQRRRWLRTIAASFAHRSPATPVLKYSIGELCGWQLPLCPSNDSTFLVLAVMWSHVFQLRVDPSNRFG